ncbi:TPA: tyrosine-type recombinase/integrase [Photobacterium damselae]
MSTLRLKLTDAAIERSASQTQHTRLRDTRFTVELRFHKNRTKASWYFIDKRRHNGRDGKARWERLGTWPQLRASELFKQLPIKLAKLATDQEHIMNSWETVGDVLLWYQHHMSSNRMIRASRRSTVKSVINKHLLPALESLALDGCKKHQIKTLLIWPLQAHYQLRTVKQYFSVLKAAFMQAHREELIVSNPIAAMRFSDFIQKEIKANDAKLLPDMIEPLLHQLQGQERNTQLLVLMQLCHGTRIGETRLAKWQHIDWERKTWRIPASNTKTGEALTLPLSEQVLALLRDHVRERRNSYLFPNKTGQGGISRTEANTRYQCVSQRQWTSHHCRKLASSRLADLGVDKFVVERIINHKMSNLDQTYIHTTTENLKREAIETYHAWLDTQGFFIFHQKTVGRSEKQTKALQSAGWL